MVWIIALGLFFAFCVVAVVHDHRAGIAPSTGTRRPEMVCPHCQTRGRVTTQSIWQKKGISGGKATGALLTGGVSMLATGLSRKEAATRATCGNCGSRWVF
jgi:DNA-directed RNA polymerase subunit RPC12/RpoP